MPFLSTADRHTHLVTQIIITFVLIVLITTISAGIAPYWLIHQELARQAWARVADGQHVTQTLLENEKARLADIAVLVAERPTLQRLSTNGDSAALTDYLRALQSSAEVDILFVENVSGEVLGGKLPDVWQDLVSYQDTPVYVSSPTDRQLIMLVTRPVIEDDTGDLLAYVTVGQLLDRDFMQQLASQTGLEQSIVVEHTRTASSLPRDGTGATEPEPRDERSFADLTVRGQPYYTTLLALRNGLDGTEPVAWVETALPVSDLVAAKQRALSLLVTSTLAVAVLGSMIGTLLARRFAAPLGQLTQAAANISRGDLTTPVTVSTSTVEIATLAAALEESRMNMHHMLDELARAKAWSDNLLGSIVEGVVTFDTGGSITFFSEGAERILGHPAEHVLGRSIDEVFRLAEAPGSEQFIDRIPPRGGKRQTNILTADGHPLTLAVTGARLAPPDSDSVQVVLVLRDVTEEEAVRRLRTHFLENITHEFRTPLAALSASVELLLDKSAELADTGVSELLESLHVSVLNLQMLIDNLLESGSIQAGHFVIRRRQIDLNHVIADAVRVVQPLLTIRKQTLSLVEPTRLPSVEADPARLIQVLINLLSNASKYSPFETGIDLTLAQQAGALRISIADRGPGIPPSDRANLFRRFIQLTSPGNHVQYGIGLGLSVAKAIVEAHNGTIGVDERPGGGSIFWFSLPVSEGFEPQ